MLGEALHVINAVLAVATAVGFLPALSHARDDTDRLYLVGGFCLLVVVVGGSVARYSEPPTWRTPLITAALVVWLVSAERSRRRRRREAGRPT